MIAHFRTKPGSITSKPWSGGPKVGEGPEGRLLVQLARASGEAARQGLLGGPWRTLEASFAQAILAPEDNPVLGHWPKAQGPCPSHPWTHQSSHGGSRQRRTTLMQTVKVLGGCNSKYLQIL